MIFIIAILCHTQYLKLLFTYNSYTQILFFDNTVNTTKLNKIFYNYIKTEVDQKLIVIH